MHHRKTFFQRFTRRYILYQMKLNPKDFSVIQKAMANKSVSINSKCKLTEIKVISARMGMELAQQNVFY